MSDGEILLQKCLLCPKDATTLGVFADWCDGNGESEIGTAVRSSRAVEYLEEVLRITQALGIFPTLRCMWAVCVLCLPDAPNWTITARQLQRRRWQSLLSSAVSLEIYRREAARAQS